MVLWEDVVTNLQMDIFNNHCCGYRATTDRKSLRGISGLVKIFYYMGRGGGGVKVREWQSSISKF